MGSCGAAGKDLPQFAPHCFGKVCERRARAIATGPRLHAQLLTERWFGLRLIAHGMDLLLTHGYFLYEDPKELQVMKPYPPLGILYICAHLRSKGLSVEVFDSTFSSRQQLFELL